MGIKRHGYNIFITGLTGTGKTSYAQTVAREKAANERVPDDWCYLYNFKNPGEPMALNLPAGMGKIFVADIDNLLEELREEIPKAFNTEEYERQKGNILKEFQKPEAPSWKNLILLPRKTDFY